MKHAPPPNATTPQVTVLYDGSCPLCRKEIGVYQRADGGDTIAWCDVSLPGAAPPGMTQEAAMVRFHVIDSTGTTKSGARAFIALWLSLPGWRWLGRIASIPPFPLVLEGLYRAFLPIRPWLQRLVRRG